LSFRSQRFSLNAHIFSVCFSRVAQIVIAREHAAVFRAVLVPVDFLTLLDVAAELRARGDVVGVAEAAPSGKRLNRA